MFAYKPFKIILTSTAPWVSKGSTSHVLTEPERYQWALDGLQSDLDLNNKLIKNLKIDLIKFEDYEQTYCNSEAKDQTRRFWFDVSYEQMEWTGSREGSQVVHKRVIKKDLIERVTPKDLNEIWHRESDMGKMFVRKRMPEVVYRVGCTCCYGDGPDLMISTTTLLNGDFEITYVVDFDFVPPEQPNTHWG